MTQSQYTHSLVHLEEVVSMLFCLIDDTPTVSSTRAPSNTGPSIGSTLVPVLHSRQVSQPSGFDGAAWVR